MFLYRGRGVYFIQHLSFMLLCRTPPGKSPFLHPRGVYIFKYQVECFKYQVKFCDTFAQTTECPFSSMTLQLNPDKTVPYPTSLEPEVASTLHENMQIAANTASLLKGLGAHVDDDPEAEAKAGEVFKTFNELIVDQYEKAMTADAPPKRGRGRPRKEVTPQDKNPQTLYSLPVADRIGNMLREYDNEFVADASQLRLVVTNKLLDLASCSDPKIEIKVSDVGLFSEKTEITVTYNNVTDLDQAIKDKVRKMLLGQGVTDITPIDIDLDAEFGPLELIEEVKPDEPAEPDLPAEDSNAG